MKVPKRREIPTITKETRTEIRYAFATKTATSHFTPKEGEETENKTNGQDIILVVIEEIKPVMELATHLNKTHE